MMFLFIVNATFESDEIIFKSLFCTVYANNGNFFKHCKLKCTCVAYLKIAGISLSIIISKRNFLVRMSTLNTKNI